MPFVRFPYKVNRTMLHLCAKWHFNVKTAFGLKPKQNRHSGGSTFLNTCKLSLNRLWKSDPLQIVFQMGDGACTPMKKSLYIVPIDPLNYLRWSYTDSPCSNSTNRWILPGDFCIYARIYKQQLLFSRQFFTQLLLFFTQRILGWRGWQGHPWSKL